MGGLPGIFWSYTVIGRDGTPVKANEVFFKKDDSMYRISYFVPEKLWDENRKDIFWNMVKSFKIY